MAFEYCTQRTLSCSTDSILVCGEGIDGNIRTLRTDQNNVAASLPSASTFSQIGRLFSTGFIGILTADSRFDEIIISNPPDSGRILYLDTIRGGSFRRTADPQLTYQQTVTISVSRNPEFGDLPQIEIRNLNLGFPDDSAMTAFFSPTNVPGQGTVDLFTQALGYFQVNYEGRIIAPPGTGIGVVLFAEGVELGDNFEVPYTITVYWYELDLPTP